MEYFSVILLLASATWVGFDAAHLGVRRGQLGGGFLDMGVVSWVLAVLLLWWLAFPCYLVARSRHVALRRPVVPVGPMYHQGHPQAYPPQQHPGYAPDPRFGSGATVVPQAPDPRFGGVPQDPPGRF